MMANCEVCPEITRLLRVQRHDFINHIQVIHALLQLGKTEKALRYLEDISKNPEMLSDSLNSYQAPAECKSCAGSNAP